jgi:diguanylate cyclase (GGDEF)-like protein
MSRDPIKLTIGLGFTGVLALMGLISFISLSQLDTINERMGSLINEASTKISAANTMRDSIRLRGDTLYKMYLTDDFIERDESRIELGKHALRYKKARDQLYIYHLTAHEAKLLNLLMKQTRETKALNDKAAEDMLSDMPIANIKHSLRQANLARHNLLAGLEELVLLQEEISQSIITDSKEYQESIRDIILFLSLAAFFIAIYIAQLVIRETSKKNSEIHFQATHDELTKLANRKEFNHRLAEAHRNAIEQHENHALCFLDLDKFKVINDSCGHKAGDELLIQLTKIIKEHIRSHDTLARIGGDEFGLLLEDCSLEKAIEITEGIVSLIKNYEFNWQDKNYHVGVSIGLIMINQKTKNIDKALSQADIACYAAKDMGRNQIHIHGLNDNHAKTKHKELSWIADINNDSSDKHFSLYLQNITALQDNNTTSMYQVLLRVTDDDGAPVSVSRYIPVAERFNLMKNIDYWVIEQTFKRLAELYKTAAASDVQLFIPISGNSIANNNFSDFVIEQYKKYNIVDNTVCLEFSEANATKNINQTADVISALKIYGIKFALDDFGTGISSFNYLKTLSIDYLKIDGNIIKNISRSVTDKAMVTAINQVGKIINIKTIAKHVEDAFTLHQLKELGIDYAQGIYIDKPLHIDERSKQIKNTFQQRTSN